jgi:amino acid transporter
MNPVGADPSLQRNVALIANSVPQPYATAVLCIVLFAMICQNIAQLLATSRFIWSLARESAIPFSHFFRTLSVNHRQPLPAIWAVILISAPSLMLLGISVSIVGTILLEAAGATVMFAYFLPIALYLCCPDDSLAGDGRAQWTLRGFSQPIAWLASGFALLFIIVLCLPTGYPVTPCERISCAPNYCLHTDLSCYFAFCAK